ncbi:MAG: YitT family protein [Gammaproteobacteria bacterium]|nr:YitT family protein [Gammaproteobacteria bacterium]MBU0787841.1 YitT family protein [Gammaproteobacteria bacterium]MBU0817041.1 YitT family protein [Gammaproteobacteria bacterium]MBU1787205.1 YitT family protein [Gammaproteobacteria bacterium]
MNEPQDTSPLRHSHAEDALALLSGTALIALAVALFQQAHLLSGGTAGLAFLLHYNLGVGFGPAFFVLNLPFYLLAWRRMDRAFLLKTMLAVALLSVMTEITPLFIRFDTVQPLYAALIGGVILGVGFLILFRHRASLGGVGILAFYLQEKRGWRAGHVQMAVDGLILLLALVTAPFTQVALSVAGAVVLNLSLAINHRAGRYIAT